ncbi:hypothetical protein EJ02DRAFT_488444 [Clathrospora elynae]|uniref:Uncharacterized protein n=1 Tax=Clathrospora elynae TaxID=706981 RepID=A0A6A5S5F3_9PLEO|nr:hypothetical protein EJ02DRAFT_488444 [Clathrospora elynae]
MKVEEILAMIREQVVPAAHADQLAVAFQGRLKRKAGLYIQAILHYEHDKASTLAKVSSHNSASTQEQRQLLTELERTKWMFPRFDNNDLAQLRIQNGAPRHGPLSNTAVRSLSRNWQTLDKSDAHTGPVGYPPHRMMRGTHLLGDNYSRLEALEQFHEELRMWTQAEDARIHGPSGEEEDTDWPERPTRRGARAETNDIDSDGIDSDSSYAGLDIDS